ncbi:type II secretion system F family protein [Halorubrum sp. BV1]|uniref:type II secretion system F family protein n=1 Tax=Halorubrum sp. BV1 TaxID=1498500 RepID=UPI00067962E3|nr:type II secretion system F family protein [Halorubrum sp. BV1]
MTGRDTSEADSSPEADSSEAADPAFREPGLDEATAEAVLDDAFDDGGHDADGSAIDTDPGGPDEESEPEPEPEEAISDPLTEERQLGEAEQATLREAYGYVRAFFKARPTRYRGLQRRLKQARVRDTYDEYLTDSVKAAVVAGFVAGIVVAAVVGGIALTTGLDVLEPLLGVTGPLRGVFVAKPLIGAVFVVPFLASVTAAGAVWMGRNYYYPRSVVAARRRSISLNLPYAITFMYALSSGGMTFDEICRQLGDNEQVYGEVANEFDVVVREIDLFGNDLLQALSNLRQLTPSDDLRRFLDDLLGVLESGGDLETFLEEEAEEYLDSALEEQESFIDTLGGLSEVFVIGFVAAPLFLIVVLMVVSFLGADTVDLIAALVYLVFPLAMAGFLLVVDLLSRPYEEPTANLSIEDERMIVTEQVADDPRFPAYQRTKRETGLRAFLADPFRAIRRRPSLSLGITIPLGGVVVGVAIWTGIVSPSVSGFLATPLRTTVGLLVGPLIATTAPVMVLHERERRRTQTITERFPDVLNILASANQMGVDIVDAFELVTRWASGTLATELEKVRNDIAWNHDLTRALLDFADRLNVPQLSRTMTLIAEGSRSSGDIAGLLEIAAADTRSREKLARARRREVGSYVAIVVVGFLVYLLVIVMVSASYLTPIGEIAASSGDGGGHGAVSLGSISVETYRLLFLHSALIQGFGSGLIAGKLAENDALSGLKYGLGLVVLTVVVFFLLV